MRSSRSKPPSIKTPKQAIPSAARTPSQLRLRRRIRIGVLVLTLLGLAAVGYFSVYPLWLRSHLLGLAEGDLERRDFEAAKAHLHRLLETDEANAKGTFLLAQTHRRLNQYDEARRYLEEAKKRDWVPESIDLEYRLMRTQEFGPRGDERILLTWIGGRHPDDKLILEGLGQGYLTVHSLMDAKRCYEIWIERYPDDWFPHLKRGEIFEAMEDGESALKEYLLVYSRQPEHSTIKRDLGRFYLNSIRDYAEAAKYLGPHLERYPDDSEALQMDAECQNGLGHPDEAQKLLDRSLAIDPQKVSALILQTDLMKDRPEAALRFLRRAEQLAPWNLLLNYRLSVALGELGRTEEAEKYRSKHKELEKNLKELNALATSIWKDPHNPELRVQLAKLMFLVGRDEAAISWLHTALAESAYFEPAHRALAEYHSQFKTPEQQSLAEYHRQMAAAVKK